MLFTAHDKGDTHIILLPFENGTLARVTLSLYTAPRGQSRPIDAYVVTECEGVFTGSSRRAAEAVFNLAGRHIAARSPMVAGFDIQGACPGLAPATGESGGLAFAIALAARLLNQNPGPLAATGVITSSEGKCAVGRVNGIQEKIRAAVENLPEQAHILYPAGNQAEIPASLFSKAKTKRQALCPVSSVAEAMAIIFPKKNSLRSVLKQRPDIRVLVLAITLVITIAAIAAGIVKTGAWFPRFNVERDGAAQKPGPVQPVLQIGKTDPSDEQTETADAPPENATHLPSSKQPALNRGFD